MSNIYRFPGTEEMPYEIDTEQEEREIPFAARIGLRAIGVILAVVVGVAVMLLFFLRWPLHIVCNVASGLGFFGALFS